MNNNSKIVEAELAVKLAELSVAKALRDLELAKGDCDVNIKGYPQKKKKNISQNVKQIVVSDEKPSLKRELCTFFPKCKFGQSCKNLHSVNCRNWIKHGKCSYHLESKCPFLHNKNLDVNVEANITQACI